MVTFEISHNRFIYIILVINENLFCPVEQILAINYLVLYKETDVHSLNCGNSIFWILFNCAQSLIKSYTFWKSTIKSSTFWIRCNGVFSTTMWPISLAWHANINIESFLYLLSICEVDVALCQKMADDFKENDANSSWILAQRKILSLN